MSQTEKLTLFSYFRSSSSWRVRIALNLKGVPFEYAPIHLLKNEHRNREYLELNPTGKVPCLLVNGKPLTESVAIIDFLENRFPDPPLFAKDPFERAKILAFCEIINSGIQPYQNLQTLADLETRFGLQAEGKSQWASAWIEKGFKALEAILVKNEGPFCFGNQPSAADCFLIPQIYGARRFGVDLGGFPRILEAETACGKLEAFKKADQAAQPDTPPA